jgi:hypothetical protein
VQRSGDVALIYRAIGVTVTAIAVAFSFSPVGRAERYLAAVQARPVERPAE